MTGPASAVESAFFVTLNEYQRPDGTTFYAPANDPSVNTTIPLLHIGGLENFSSPRPSGGTGAACSVQITRQHEHLLDLHDAAVV